VNTAYSSNRPCAASKTPRRAVCVCRGGFSLVELTVVLAIIAIVGSMALPRYNSSLSRYRVDLSAKRFAADLALAQSAARSTGSFQTVVIDKDNDRYRLNEQASLTSTGARYLISLNSNPFFTSIRSAKNAIGDDVLSLKFDGYGRPNQALIAKLVSGDHSRIVTVDAQSGAINVSTP
jgi:type II secretion system protein H